MDASKYQLLLSALIAAQDAGKLEDLDTGEVRLYARAGAISILLGGTLLMTWMLQGLAQHM